MMRCIWRHPLHRYGAGKLLELVSSRCPSVASTNCRRQPCYCIGLLFARLQVWLVT